MGMDRKVVAASLPKFEDWAARMARAGFPVQLRMIDGELAFPDETPPPAWRELRLGTPQGMVTLRRQADRVLVVTWGNDDPPLVQAWNAVAWAVARAGGGTVETPEGALAAEAFGRRVELPPAFST